MVSIEQVDRHYGFGGLMERIEDALKLANKEPGSLSVDDLAPVDEFHTRGRESTLEVAQLAALKGSDVVLDVGCGLGGTARHLAAEYGCMVHGLDLTHEYISVGSALTERVGLSSRVQLKQGNALALPFDDGSFDVVWTEHAQMNIADKDLFYTEIARVLKPGGRFLFHDIFRGSGEDPIYPAPWAESEQISSLTTEQRARGAIEGAGMEISEWIGKVPESIEFFEKVLKRIEAEGPPPLGIHLLMGDNAREKIQNYTRNLKEERVSVVIGMAQKI